MPLNSTAEHIPGFEYRATGGLMQSMGDRTMKLSGLPPSHSPWKSPKSGDYHIPTARRLRTFELCSNRIRSTLWDVIGAHLSCKISSNGSEAADNLRVERDAIHGIKPNGVPRDEGHYTFRSTRILSTFHQLTC